jgi:hypothetical protein
VSRPDAGQDRPWAGRSGRVPDRWLPVWLCALGAALVGVAVVWFLTPRAPDAFSVVGNALQAGPGHASHGPGVSVYFRSGASSGAPSPVPTGSGTPSPAVSSPAKGSLRSPRQDAPSAAPTVIIITNARREASPPALRTALIGRDVAKAAAYSPTVAVETGPVGSFAVAPVNDTGHRSTIPLLLAAALLGALAWLGGVLFGRRRARWEPESSASPGPTTSPSQAASLPPGTEPVASRELQRLRRDAEQKTLLARSLAELVPSMPDALVWQAERALADVGVRQVVPDGEPFDPAAHFVVGTEPVPAGGREDIIARTIRPGYADDENILVFPKVVVYADDTGRRGR